MADISSIKLPSGSSYNIKDAAVRNTISGLAFNSTYVVENKVLDNISVAKTTYSGSGGQGSVEKTLSASKSGYTAIGILDYRLQNATTDGVGASFTRFYRVYLSNATTITMAIANDGGSNAKVKATIKVLYKKN